MNEQQKALLAKARESLDVARHSPELAGSSPKRCLRERRPCNRLGLDGRDENGQRPR